MQRGKQNNERSVVFAFPLSFFLFFLFHFGGGDLLQMSV